MPRAWLLVRPQPHYRRDAFAAGLRACGFEVLTGHPDRPRPEDVCVVWNRYGQGAAACCAVEAAGGRALVAENGYIGQDGQGRQLYAVAIGQHNGGGWWPVGGPERWSGLGVELAPWRMEGGHILVLPQRGIGPSGVAMPKDWTEVAVRILRRKTKRNIVVRPHPGQSMPERPLSADLEGAWAVVTWGSGAAIKALAAGIPVFHDMPGWIGAPAAMPLDGADLERPFLCDRRPMFERLAWAQWTVDEISEGLPFRRLLEVPPC